MRCDWATFLLARTQLVHNLSNWVHALESTYQLAFSGDAFAGFAVVVTITFLPSHIYVSW